MNNIMMKRKRTISVPSDGMFWSGGGWLLHPPLTHPVILGVRNERIMRSMSVSGCAKQARFRERKSNITMLVPGELSAYRAYHHQRTSLACAR